MWVSSCICFSISLPLLLGSEFVFLLFFVSHWICKTSLSPRYFRPLDGRVARTSDSESVGRVWFPVDAYRSFFSLFFFFSSWSKLTFFLFFFISKSNEISKYIRKVTAYHIIYFTSIPCTSCKLHVVYMMIKVSSIQQGSGRVRLFIKPLVYLYLVPKPITPVCYTKHFFLHSKKE